MPVAKYRSVVEMPGPRPLDPLNADNLRIACELTELSYGLRSWRLEAGVHKFASAEDAFAARKRKFASQDAGAPIER